MVTLLITSFLLLTAISYAIYRLQRSAAHRGAEYALAEPEPPRPRGLFADTVADEARALLSEGETGRGLAAERRKSLLERAARGDREALGDAHRSGDAGLYDAVLNELAERASSEKSLLSLVSYIARGRELRVNKRLAEKFLEDWQSAPDRRSTAQALHVAALANDAPLYERAIEAAFQFWREGRLAQLSAAELRQLIESEFWILAPAVRNSGAGFVLKRRLATLRRQLGAATTTDGQS
ncbi:MAG TPA: hypothetical protein VF723_17275 [Pyrinomonadaceae bacterium]|jgi:hypothetical protein